MEELAKKYMETFSILGSTGNFFFPEENPT